MNTILHNSSQSRSGRVFVCDFGARASGLANSRIKKGQVGSEAIASWCNLVKVFYTTIYTTIYTLEIPIKYIDPLLCVQIIRQKKKNDLDFEKTRRVGVVVLF